MRLASFGLVSLIALCSSSSFAQAQESQPDSATERKWLVEALDFVREKKFVFAVAKLAPLVKSSSLPAPVAKVIPGLIDDLRRLDAVARLAADWSDRQVPAVSVELLPARVKRPYAWLELLRAVGVLLETPVPVGSEFPWNAEQAKKLLEAVASEFDADAAGKLRIELSAKLFLAGKPLDATELIKDETPNEYAREVLADLRTIVLGGGTLKNPQVARFITEKGLSELPGAATFMPATQRDKWVRPKQPPETETTLAKLEKRARKDVSPAAAIEVENLTKKVTATTDAIRISLGKP